MLIMGFGPRKPRDQGAVAPALCPNCANHVTFHLLELRNWFSVFFIPLVPGKARYLVYCPTCRYGVQIDGAQLEAARELVGLASEHNGTVESDAHRAKVDAFWSMLGGERLADAPDAQFDAPPPTAATAAPAPPPGWYTDPFQEAEQRYWDGERWTAGTNPPSFRS